MADLVVSFCRLIRGRSAMWAIDHSSMILIILGGLYVGIRGALGVDLAPKYFGSFEHIIFILIGLSAVWQFARQRFPI
jgi:uncharacterized membrane protein YuzA (DUF378 family)